MRILWVYPSFMDYRVPVYAELDRLTNHKLTLIYSKARTPQRVVRKLENELGTRAIGLSGERVFHIGKETEWANKSLRIPYQRGLLKEVLSRKADVLVGDGFFQWTPLLVLKKYIQKVPLVLNYQKTAHTERNCPGWRTAYRKLILRCVDAMVCNGKLSAEYSANLGMKRDRIFTAGNPAESEVIRRKCERITIVEREQKVAALGLTRPVFLFVGRMIKLKGIAELLNGWEVYKNQKSGQGSLLLVGEGDQLDSLQRWAKERRLQNVYFTGGVNYDDIAKYYASADVFIMPTLEDNWSLVVPEAMACGLPIACSKYNGCWPELIKPGENGIIFDPLKPEDVANSLRFFSAHQNALEGMGKLSRHIVDEFTPQRAALAVLKACEVALSPPLA